MNNILLITPLYRIEGREELFRDSEAIYYLTKYWNNKDINLYVINNIVKGLSDIKNVFKNKYFKYLFKGYDYNIENIKVTLIERQNLVPNKITDGFLSSSRQKKIIENKLKSNNFIPDKIVVHLPSTSISLVSKLKYNCEKIAVLHMTDVKYLYKNGNFIDYLNSNFSKIYCRSRHIYNIFSKTNIKNLEKTIIYSGVKINNIVNIKNFNKDKYTFLYAGKLIKRKNLDILINALSKIDLNKWELNVIGEGPCLNEYKQLVDKYNLNNNVKFLGYVSKDEVNNYMRNSDVFCMPSIGETFGLVYLEAMSFGCLTIGTINEGIDGVIINNNNGYLVYPDVDSLYNTINSIFDCDYNILNNISMNAINTSREFEEENVSYRYLRIIMGDENGEIKEK